MKKDEFTARFRIEMADVHVSPQLRRKTIDMLNGKENPVMKKKRSAAAVLVMALFLVVTAAIAAAARVGLLEFAGNHANTYMPEDAQNYVQQDVLTMENETVMVRLRELYYDGLLSRMTVDVTPKRADTLLVGEDVSPEDPWSNLSFSKQQTETAADERTVAQHYQENGYQAAYRVDVGILPLEGNSSGGSMDFCLNEDGTLTLYVEEEYEGGSQPQREAMLALYLTEYTDRMAGDSQQGETVVLKTPLTLAETEYQKETYVSVSGADYPAAGVRVDEIRMEVRALDIHTTIDFSVTDREAYDRLEDGLWFEFIDPQIEADEPSQQRLLDGLTSSGSVSPLDGDDMATASRFRQSISIGRNELHETYTLRAYECWGKERFETNTFVMKRADEN